MVNQHQLFLAMTRPTMILRVTVEALAFEIACTALFFIYSGYLFGSEDPLLPALLIVLPLHALNMALVAYDPAAYRIAIAWLTDYMTIRNRRYWRGASLRS